MRNKWVQKREIKEVHMATYRYLCNGDIDSNSSRKIIRYFFL